MTDNQHSDSSHEDGLGNVKRPRLSSSSLFSTGLTRRLRSVKTAMGKHQDNQAQVNQARVEAP